MVSLTSLWLPIVISAVVVFFASFIVHMVLPFHRKDFRKLPAEDEVLDALRRFNIPAGDYLAPNAGGPEAMRTKEFQEKFARGPVFTATFRQRGRSRWGRNWGCGSCSVSSSHSSPVTWPAARCRLGRNISASRKSRARRRSSATRFPLVGRDLVQPIGADADPRDDRWHRVWTFDGWRLRLALAAVVPLAAGQ
jgi:hypothetical protein